MRSASVGRATLLFALVLLSSPPLASGRRRMAGSRTTIRTIGPCITAAMTRSAQSLAQINKDNVKNLTVAWVTSRAIVQGLEATPLVVDGVMYTSPLQRVFALDGATGRSLAFLSEARSGGTRSSSSPTTRRRGRHGRVYFGASRRVSPSTRRREGGGKQILKRRCSCNFTARRSVEDKASSATRASGRSRARSGPSWRPPGRRRGVQYHQGRSEELGGNSGKFGAAGLDDRSYDPAEPPDWGTATPRQT